MSIAKLIHGEKKISWAPKIVLQKFFWNALKKHSAPILTCGKKKIGRIISIALQLRFDKKFDIKFIKFLVI